MSTNPLVEMIETFLRDLDAWHARQAAAEERWRANGYRLVGHDQTPDKRLTLNDLETGEQLFLGSLEEGDVFLAQHRMAVLDSVRDEAGFDETDETEVPGVPLELQVRVRDWVDNRPDEARAYLHELSQQGAHGDEPRQAR